MAGFMCDGLKLKPNASACKLFMTVCGDKCRFAQGTEANVIHQLLDEVLSTALERALEPQLLEGMVLEKIMSAYQSK